MEDTYRRNMQQLHGYFQRGAISGVLRHTHGRLRFWALSVGGIIQAGYHIDYLVCLLWTLLYINPFYESGIC